MRMEDKILGEMMESNDPDSDTGDIFVNAEDGLGVDYPGENGDGDTRREEANRRLQYRLLNGEWEDIDVDLDDLIDEDFPTCLIVTGLTKEFFDTPELKTRFEGLFRLYGTEAEFHYFKSFKRVRVTYTTAASAIQARIKMHLYELGENELKCFFGQNPVVKKGKPDGLLHPPTPDKQFLISPPPSPPVDWEPMPESHPNVNFDLLSAIAKLNPGEAHELHKPEKESHPSIIVHIAPGDENVPTVGGRTISEDKQAFIKIQQTRRPEV